MTKTSKTRSEKIYSHADITIPDNHIVDGIEIMDSIVRLYLRKEIKRLLPSKRKNNAKK